MGAVMLTHEPHVTQAHQLIEEDLLATLQIDAPRRSEASRARF
jgi:hypothetical protein